MSEFTYRNSINYKYLYYSNRIIAELSIDKKKKILNSIIRLSVVSVVDVKLVIFINVLFYRPCSRIGFNDLEQRDATAASRQNGKLANRKDGLARGLWVHQTRPVTRELCGGCVGRRGSCTGRIAREPNPRSNGRNEAEQ